VAARAEFPTRGLQAGMLGAGLLLGLLAGVDPKLALIGAFGLAFVVLTMVDLTAGLCLLAIISFIDSVLPYGTTGVISFPKLLGLLVVMSWLGRLATDPEERARLFPHTGFIYVLFVFAAWTAMSITWAVDSGSVLDTVLRVVPNAMLFPIVYSAIRTRRQLMWLLGSFVLGALISAAYGVFVPTDPNAQDRLSGAAGNANETAAALVAGAVLAGALAATLRDQPLLRLAAGIGMPLCAFALFLTLSRGGLVALATALVAAIVMGGRWRGIVLALAVIAAVGCVTYFGVFASTQARERVTTFRGGTGRTDVWTVGWRMVQAHPVRGVGAGTFAESSVHYLLRPGSIKRDDFIVDTPKAAHNMYLEVLAELGVVGLALFLAIIGFSLACLVRAVRRFNQIGDRQLEILSRAMFVALVGLLASDFFGSREFAKELWLLLSICPAVLAMSRARSRELEEGSLRARPPLVAEPASAASSLS
jgi:O-antigen ligase